MTCLDGSSALAPRLSPAITVHPTDSIHRISQHRPAGYYSLAVRSLAFVSHGKNRHVPIPHLIRRCTQSASPLLLLALAVSAAGCHPPETRVHIRDFQHPGGPRSLHQNFDEAYYTIDPDGKLRLVLRNEAPSIAIPTENISQVLLIETFWRPIPGITFVESSMINANLTYLIRSGPTARAYEGNGFVSFKENRRKGLLTGKIESANLRPTGQFGNPPAPFGRAHLDGTFRATNRSDRATNIFTQTRNATQALNPVD